MATYWPMGHSGLGGCILARIILKDRVHASGASRSKLPPLERNLNQFTVKGSFLACRPGGAFCLFERRPTVDVVVVFVVPYPFLVL